LQSAEKFVGVQEIVCVRLSSVRYHRLSFFVTAVRSSVMMLEIGRIHMVQRYGLALLTCVVTFEIHVVKLRVLVTSSVWKVSIDVMAC